MAMKTRSASRNGSSRQRDAIAILKEDHREVERWFKAFEKTSDDATKERRRIVDTIIKDLSRHAAIEEQLLYPWARDFIVDIDDTVFEAFEEHRVVKFLLSELATMDAGDERFAAKTKVLTESVRHHVKEEESELFQYLRDVGTRGELLELGHELELAKRTAPTTPGLEGLLPAVGGGVGAALDHARGIGREALTRVGSLTGIGD